MLGMSLKGEELKVAGRERNETLCGVYLDGVFILDYSLLIKCSLFNTV